MTSSKPKYFLVIRNPVYYPNASTSDWLGVYATVQEAEESISYLKDSSNYHDPVVVDLRDWIYRTN